MNKEGVLKLVLWAICIYHVVLGGGALLSPHVAEQIARSIFGITLHMSPEISYVVRVLGVYALAFGLLAGAAATNPTKHRDLLNLIVVLYALRIVVKLAFKDEAVMGLAYTPIRVFVEAALLAAFGLSVLLLKPRPRAA